MLQICTHHISSESRSTRHSSEEMRKAACAETDFMHRGQMKMKEAKFLSGSKSVALVIKNFSHT